MTDQLAAGPALDAAACQAENEALRAQVVRLADALSELTRQWSQFAENEEWSFIELAQAALRATPADALAWLDRERKRAAAEELEQEWEYPFLRAAELRKELEAD